MSLTHRLVDALQSSPPRTLERCEGLVARMQLPDGAMPETDAARRSLVIMLSRGVLNAAGIRHETDPTLEEALQIRMAVIRARMRFREMLASASPGHLAARMLAQRE